MVFFSLMFCRYVDASPPWAKQLQADLPAGTTVVTFTAWSPVSNYTSTCRIVIRVRGEYSKPTVQLSIVFDTYEIEFVQSGHHTWQVLDVKMEGKCDRV